MIGENKIYITASELAEMLGVSVGHAYKIIRKLNQELAEQGFLVIAGKVPRCYIGSTFVYVARKVCVYSVWDFIYYYRVLGVKG